MGRGRFQQSPSWPWILAGLAAGLALAATLDPRLYINGDNVEYIFLGRAVRAGHLWASDKFPPLFPLMLAPVQAVFGLRLLPQKLLVLLFGFGCVWLLGRILRRRFSDRSGPWLLWITATLIPLVEFSHYTMSEIPFLFFMLGAVDAFDRRPREDRRPPGIWGMLKTRHPWFLALWIAAAFYTRSAGISLALGLGLVLVLGRAYREAAALGLALLPLCLPWLLRSALSSGGSPYLHQFLLVNPYYPEFGSLTISSLLRRLWENGGFYLLQETPGIVFPLLYNSTYSPPGEAYFPIWISIPLLFPLIAGLTDGIRRRDPAAGALVLSLALSLVWPIIWAGSRFLVPIVPLLFLYWWKGWTLPEQAGWRGPWPWIRSVLLVLLLLLSARNLVFYKLETREYAPEWKRYFAALEWIRAQTPKDSIIIDRKPGLVEYVAERKAFSFPREAEPDRMLQAFRQKGATHVLLSSLPYDDIGRYLNPAIEQRRDFFDVLARWADPPTYVLRFYPDGKGVGSR